MHLGSWWVPSTKQLPYNGVNRNDGVNTVNCE